MSEVFLYAPEDLMLETVPRQPADMLQCLPMLGFHMIIKLKLSGNEVYNTNSSILLGKNMLCDQLDC